jgi:acyl-CoA reductase-like NAD-dependent aldehyde dehydrogenase
MDRPGNYFHPTVIAGATNDMDVMREESFGPIIGICSVKDDAEALRLMNDTEYGLTAGVYCREQDRAALVLSGVHAGSAYWNCCDRVSPRLPWSGRGHSGLGTTLSVLGIRAFVQPKAWHLRKA